jgi:hypothetical protein
VLPLTDFERALVEYNLGLSGAKFVGGLCIRSNTMEKRHRALLLDTDPDTPITLQHALEEAGIDATVTWDEIEACQLIRDRAFRPDTCWGPSA